MDRKNGHNESKIKFEAKVSFDVGCTIIFRGSTLFIEKSAWNDSVNRLQSRALFLKWLEPWPSIQKVHN